MPNSDFQVFATYEEGASWFMGEIQRSNISVVKTIRLTSHHDQEVNHVEKLIINSGNSHVSVLYDSNYKDGQQWKLYSLQN